jgi:hypothetical protein
VWLNPDPVTPAALTGFYRLLGASLVARVATDACAGIYGVHTGELFPWRHLPLVPLYSPLVLALEWFLLGASGLALLTLRSIRVALCVALLATGMGLSQRFSNQSALALIVLVLCTLDITLPTDLGERVQRPNLDLIRYQLLIVYGFSALNKLRAGFLNGDTLAHLLHIPHSVSQPLSWAAVLAELALPLLFVAKRCGTAWVGVLVLHTGFSLLLPGLLPFGLLMLALATLWLRERRSPPSHCIVPRSRSAKAGIWASNSCPSSSTIW